MTVWTFLDFEDEDDDTDSEQNHVGDAVDEAGRSRMAGEQAATQDEEEHKHSIEDQAALESQSEASLFIPIGFPRPGPVSYYKGTDPEWQRFCQLDQSHVTRSLLPLGVQQVLMPRQTRS